MTAAAYARFLASMTYDREKWHDGIGYDLGALDEATADERRRIETLLLDRQPPDWRDLEALARIGSPAARHAIRAALRHADPAVRGGALRHGREFLSSGERLLAIRRALEEATFYNGLSEALEAIETFHPLEIIDLLLRALLAREPEVAVHLAALLLFLHGRAAEPFDWAQRPFFLRFAEEDREKRVPAFEELCGLIGCDPGPYVQGHRQAPLP